MKQTLFRSIGMIALLLLSNCGGGSSDGDSWRSFSASVRNFVYGRKSFILTNGNTVIIKSYYREDDQNVIGPDGTSSPLDTGRGIPVYVYVGQETDIIAAAQNNTGVPAIKATANYIPTDDLGSGVLELNLPNERNMTWVQIVRALTKTDPYYYNTATGDSNYGTMGQCTVNLTFTGEEAGLWGARSTVTLPPQVAGGGAEMPTNINGLDFKILLAK